MGSFSAFPNRTIHGLSAMVLLVVFPILTMAYLLIVRRLRYSRIRAIEKAYSLNQEKGTTMTVNEAYEVTMSIATLEFPSTFTYAIRLGMFKSYAIPSISSLLTRTGHFESAETASLRAANTGALLTEIFFHPPGSARGIQALARTNYLHSGYKKNGQISNDDMAYTLALSVLEPIRWINKYEWRKLSPVEKDALGIYFKSLGEMLHISYSDLRSSSWKDGIAWLEDLEEWADQYEDNEMRFAESNKKVATHVASALGPTLKPIVIAMLEEDRRQAIGFDMPSWPHRSSLISALLSARGQFVRFCCLPRFNAVSMTGDPADKPGHFWAKSWSIHPWYMKPSLWSKYSPTALFRKMTGRIDPDGDGHKFQPEGYEPSLIGPPALRGKGIEFMENEKKWLHGAGASKCPFLAT